MAASVPALIALLLLASGIASAWEGYDSRPILMDRRDLPFPEIVSGLKTKTLGGRMRFGKRSLGVQIPRRPLWAWTATRDATTEEK